MINQQKAVTALRVLYPIWAIVGLFGIMYVPAALIVLGDATTTANNIVTNEFLFRLSIVSNLITMLFQILIVLILYKLFKSVDRDQSLLMVILALIGVPIAMFNIINQVAALLLLNDPDQMMFFLNLNTEGVMIASVFWGLWLFPLGYLIHKSGYFPKVLGIFVIISGFGYLIGSFINFLLPNQETILQVLEFLTIGEVLFMLWVLLKGAKFSKEKSQN